MCNFNGFWRPWPAALQKPADHAPHIAHTKNEDNDETDCAELEG